MLLPPLFQRPRKTLDQYPQDKILHYGIAVFILGALAWDYAETIADITSTSRMSQFKKQTRLLRQLRADYLSIQKIDLDSERFKKLEEHSLELEDLNRENLNKLSLTVGNELSRFGLPAELTTLAKAVVMAQTIVDAIMEYGAVCDKEIADFLGHHRKTVVPVSLRGLHALLPEFMPVSLPEIPSKAIVSKIFAEQAKQMTFYDENGEF